MDGSPGSWTFARAKTATRRILLIDKYAAAGAWLAETRVGPFPTSIFFVALYLLLVGAIVSALSTWGRIGAGVDDSEQLSYMPYLWIGYGGSQPPLITWLNWAAAALFGTNLATLKLVRNALVLLCCASLYAAMRRLGYSRATAVAAMFGVIAMPELFWETQRTRTHTTAAIAFNAVALVSLAHVFDRRTMLAYALFGVAAGLAILAKYNDALFLAALLLAAVSIERFRPAILDRRIAISVVIAAAMVTPNLLWDFAHPSMLFLHSYKFGIRSDGDPLGTLLLGLWRPTLSLYKNLRLSAAVLIFAFLAAKPPTPSDRAPTPAQDHLLWRAPLVGFAVILILYVAFRATRVEDRWLFPVIILLPLAFSASCERFGDRGREAQYIATSIVAAIAVLSFPLNLYNNLIGGGINTHARSDYWALYRELTSDGPVQTVLTRGTWAGSFRLVDPTITAIHDEMPNFPSLVREPAVLVWRAAEPPSETMLDELRVAGFVLAGEPRSFQVTQNRLSRRHSIEDFMSVRLVKQAPAPGGS